MAELTVRKIEPARIATEAAGFGANRGRSRERETRGRPNRIPRVLAAALPQVDPDECEMLYRYDAFGQVDGVVVRNTMTLVQIACFDLADLTRLVVASGQSGVLLERRG